MIQPSVKSRFSRAISSIPRCGTKLALYMPKFVPPSNTFCTPEVWAERTFLTRLKQGVKR